MSDRTDELKPCPFCGGEAERTNQHDSDAVVHYARCLRCGTKTVPFLREEDAVMRWNTRYERTCKWSPFVLDPDDPSEHHFEYEDYWKTECGEAYVWGVGCFPNFCPNCSGVVVRRAEVVDE